VAAHSSQPALGQNAISAMAHLILALDQEHARVNSLPPPSEMGHPQMSVTLITGGQARNVIPDRCRIQLSRRLVVGETPEAVAAHLEAFATQHCPLPVTLHYYGGVQAFYQSPETPWIQQLAAWSGVRPATAPYGTNMGAYVGLARDAVVFGPGDIAQAHGEVEWVAVAELAKAARVYEQWWGLA
jgi:acetylornithine deacetylase/succinyl-diaminopimelate desuccinylase-like protein